MDVYCIYIYMQYFILYGITINVACFLRPSEGEDIEIMGATTPPAPRLQAPRVQKPPEPLEPPSSEGFLSRKPPEPQMPPRYVKEHALPAQPSTPPKSGLTSCQKMMSQ